MNQKELNELRRRFRFDRTAISRVYGCYVNGAGEIISRIDASLGMMNQDEAEMYLKLLKKALAGTLGKNLIDIVFTTKQVMDSEEHRLLNSLRTSCLQDSFAREDFYQKVIAALNMDGQNYLILLASDRYDVPHRGKDGETFEEGSEQVFTYFVCCVCPVKDAALALRYDAEMRQFHSTSTGQVVANPVAGFPFPAFDDRSANLYNALYYSADPADLHDELIDALFHTEEPPMSAAEQKENFHAVLCQSLDRECSFETVQAVHEQLRERIEAHKESKDPETPALSVREVQGILRDSGVSEQAAHAFESGCAESFGEGVVLNPANLIDSPKLVITTPEVKISVDPASGYSIEMRTIGGRNYLLIPADDGVEVNGVPVVTGQ